MVKRIVGWFVLLPFCAVLVIFALANRQTVAIGVDPFASANPAAPVIEIPLFVVIYAMLVLGIVLGGMAAWFAQGRNRRALRQARRDNKQLNVTLEKQRQQQRQGGGALPEPDDFFDDE